MHVVVGYTAGRLVPYLLTPPLVLGLAAVWLFAGARKLTDIVTNVRSVNAYRLFPYGLAQVIGSAQPFQEIALGVLLLAGLGVRASAVISAEQVNWRARAGQGAEGEGFEPSRSLHP